MQFRRSKNKHPLHHDLGRGLGGCIRRTQSSKVGRVERAPSKVGTVDARKVFPESGMDLSQVDEPAWIHVKVAQKGKEQIYAA
jgi:hypothetical protein